MGLIEKGLDTTEKRLATTEKKFMNLKTWQKKLTKMRHREKK